MKQPAKLEFEQLTADMETFLHFPDVENAMKDEKRRRIQEANVSGSFADPSDGPVAKILSVLSAGNTDEYKTRMKYLLATSGGSLEALDRVCAEICPDVDTWAKRWRSRDATKTIAEFLYNPTEFESIPWFVAEQFRLPDQWVEMMRANLSGQIHRSLRSLYSTKTGLALETSIGKIVEGAGYTWNKGFVKFVDDKEVDVSVPDLELPRVLIMASYNLTTSSAQSERARAQQSMYEKLRTYNSTRAQAKSPDVQLVNVIDGGGWISRDSDLQEMHRHCDYAFAFKQLGRLPDVLHYHMKIEKES